MKHLILLTLCLIFQNTFSQTDTLYFGNRKFALQRVKTHYSSWQPGVARLPMEYAPLPRSLTIPAVLPADSVHAYETDDQVGRYLVTKPYAPEIRRPMTIHLDHFLDTVRMPIADLPKLKAYIKSKGRRYELTSLRMQHLCNGQSTEFNVPHVSGNLFAFFEFFDDAYHQQTWKHSSFIVTDLYYQKGLTTYYLNRTLILYGESFRLCANIFSTIHPPGLL